MNISEIEVLFQLTGYIPKHDLNDYAEEFKKMSYEEIANNLKFGYSHNYGNFILPSPGEGLLQYTKEPQELPGFEGTYVLGFKTELWGIETISTDLEEVIKKWPYNRPISGLPVLFDENLNKLKRIDSSFFRF